MSAETTDLECTMITSATLVTAMRASCELRAWIMTLHESERDELLADLDLVETTLLRHADVASADQQKAERDPVQLRLPFPKE